MNIKDVLLAKVRLHVYEQLLKALHAGNTVTMVNLFNSGIIVDVEKIGERALETIIRMEKKRLNKR